MTGITLKRTSENLYLISIVVPTDNNRLIQVNKTRPCGPLLDIERLLKCKNGTKMFINIFLWPIRANIKQMIYTNSILKLTVHWAAQGSLGY